MASKKFSSLKSANGFAERVNGKVNDLSKNPDAKAKFSVTYKGDSHLPKKQRQRNQNFPIRERDMRPEDGCDFGYPNSYWQD